MKKTYTIENIDCGHCASKIEDAINKIQGITKAKLNFLTQKLTIEADDAEFDRVMDEAVSISKKIEPDCEILI